MSNSLPVTSPRGLQSSQVLIEIGQKLISECASLDDRQRESPHFSADHPQLAAAHAVLNQQPITALRAELVRHATALNTANFQQFSIDGERQFITQQLRQQPAQQSGWPGQIAQMEKKQSGTQDIVNLSFTAYAGTLTRMHQALAPHQEVLQPALGPMLNDLQWAAQQVQPPAKTPALPALHPSSMPLPSHAVNMNLDPNQGPTAKQAGKKPA